MIPTGRKIFQSFLLAAVLLAAGPARDVWAADPALAGKTVPADQDKDGRPDHWVTYNANGVRALIASDTNGDGKPDSWKHPIRGMMILKEKDRNFDGRVDDRQVTDFVYDKTLKFNRHLYQWRETDDDFDGIVDTYRVRGEKTPNPDRRGTRIDPAPWSEAKEAAIAKERAAQSSGGSAAKEQVLQMNARQAIQS
jgi:hypothetical protein